MFVGLAEMVLAHRSGWIRDVAIEDFLLESEGTERKMEKTRIWGVRVMLQLQLNQSSTTRASSNPLQQLTFSNFEEIFSSKND